MANGRAVALPLESEIPFAREEIAIGEAAAEAVAAMSVAVSEYWACGHSTSVKTLGGETIAKLYTLQMSAPDGLDFSATVRIAGRRELQRRWRSQYGTDLPDNMFDVFLDGVLEVVAKVTAFERAMAH
jgi:hypothetical protein